MEPVGSVDLEEWEAKCSTIQVEKSDMDRLVMDFLVTEGYYDAAKAFSKETSISIGSEEESLRQRDMVRDAFQNGRVQEGMSATLDLDVDVFSDKDLTFRVKQQELLELIRSGDSAAALEFAQTQMAPRVEEKWCLEEIEKTMALLAFDPEDAAKSPVGHLLASEQRFKTAARVNEAILKARMQEPKSALAALSTILHWAQEKLREERVVVPMMKGNGKWEVADKNKDKQE